MCLILVAWRKRAGMPLAVAANRDELHARPSAAAAFWPDAPGLLAGHDLQARGTWLGVSRGGRFAAVTNFRGGFDPAARASRGALVADFLAGAMAAGDYVAGLAARRDQYSGFNLLVADREELWWLSNRGDGARRLEPGCYALGNFLLDTAEVTGIRERFAASPFAVAPLFDLLAAAKIVAPVYGTRCSTVVLASDDGRTHFAERPFDAAGADGATSRYEFDRTG
jgi:uncharacterized protein with NRDE domain